MKKCTKIALSLLLLIIMAVSPALVMNVSAAETQELYIETRFSQSDAREMLDLINKFRTDSTGGAWYWNSDDTTKTVFNTGSNTTLGVLKYDYELEKVAMQRAAEIAVSFSHTRPTGSTCFSAFPSSGYNYKGENLAAGYGSASAAFVGWQENDDPYSGQGHRRNMLNPNFNAIGIGHVYVNGVHYWTQALGYTTNTTTPTTAVNDTVISVVTVDSSKLSLENTALSGESSYSLLTGESVTAPKIVNQYNFEEHWPGYTYVTTVPTAVNWQSKNSAVAYVEDGKIIAAGIGSTVLTASNTNLQITVTVKPPIDITTQPKTTYAKLGSTAKFTVAASGEGLTYEWYYKNPGSSSFTKSTSTSASYSAAMTESTSGQQVYCEISDSKGNKVKTNTVYLYMAASITKQPTDTSAPIGGKLSVSVSALGDGLTYQWYYKKPGSSTFSKSSVTSATYSTTMLADYSGRQMYCVVTDKMGNTATSDTFTITGTAAKITTQPKTTYAKYGATAKLTIAASGEGLTYQWYYKKSGSSSFTKSSVTSATYSVTMSETYSDRLVYCVVTDKYGNTAQSNTVTLRMKATITKQPVSTSVPEGSKLSVSVSAVGDGLTYQWYYKAPGSSSYTKSTITSATYSTTMKSTYSGRQMYCVVTDKYGYSETSDTFTITESSLKITTQPKTTYAKIGSTVKITVAANGEGLTYQWYYKKPGASSFSKSSITSATYSTTMMADYSGRQMYCVVTDKYGNTIKSNTIYLYSELTITKQPVSTTVSAGSKLSVSVTATGDGLTYQWYYKKPGSSTFTKSSITSATYSTTMMADYSGRQMYCLVTDKYGNTAISNIITISTPSVKITTQPKTTYVKIGSTAKLTVAASGEGLTYQWYYKAPGSSVYTKSSITSATYSTAMKELYSGRLMYCLVTDKYGNTAKSDAVYLYMAATITKQPVSTTASAGSKLSVSVSAVGDGLTYQWYYKAPGSSSYSKSSYTSSTYSIIMKADYSGRQMYCLVTDKYGNTAKSDVFTISTTSVKITTQPKTTYVKIGSTVKITVAASGEGLTYQWYYKAPGSSSFTKSSITSATYSTAMKELYSGRQMYCVVTDKNGNSVKSDVVYLYMAATITKQPVTTTVFADSKLSVSVSAVGDGLTYQWYYKKPGSSSFTKSSITSATYATTMKTDYSGRQMYCVVTDKYGNTAKSDTIYIYAAAQPDSDGFGTDVSM